MSMITNMQKNIEVEVRALVANLDDFESTLVKMGANFVGESYLCDIYFCKRSASSVEEVEMHEEGSYSLRLRKSKTDGTESYTLNTKTIIREGDHNAWEEHETVVDSFEETQKILTLTEFAPFFKLEKNRRVYSYGEIEIAVEDIVDFGGAVEIEIMTHSGEEGAAKEKLIEFLASVGVTKDNILPKSITNIVMKERAFKQKIEF
jgi:predicted adenylyl cyclase CyaB